MKTRVIYITGQAYSGSTFLCALLGVHPDMVPVSELSKWTTESFRKPDRLCACGKKVNECDFWAEIYEQWTGAEKPGIFQKYVELQDRFEHISSIWKNGLADKPKGDFLEYQEMTIGLLKIISHVSKCSIIIDSSKLPGRAVALSKIKDLDVSIIHLVRGGLPYLASSLKREKIHKTRFHQILSAFRWGSSWSITNLSSAYALQANRGKGIMVRYEDLISNPVQTLGAIEAALQIDLSAIKDHILHNKPIPYRHIATGSAHRYTGSTSIIGTYNDTQKIDPLLKFAFYLGAGIASNFFGYPWAPMV